MAYQSELEKLQTRYFEKPEQWFAALADQYRKAGDLEEALRIVREGIELRPNYVSGHIVHGRCLVDQEEDVEAGLVFEQVLEFDSENIIALRMLGEIGERTGNIEDAQRWLGRLLEVDPNNEDGREILNRIEGSGVGVADADEAPVDFADEPELPVDRDRDQSDDSDAFSPDAEGATVEMSPPSAELADDTATAEPPVTGPDEAEALVALSPEDSPAVAEIPEEAPPLPDAITPDTGEGGDGFVDLALDPAEPEPEAEQEAVAKEESSTADEPPFVIRHKDPFAPDEDDEDEEPVSFDSVLPDNEGGVFGVTEIDFESDRWKQGRTSDGGIDLPVGEQELSLDNLPAPTGDSGLPVGDAQISLDDINTRESGFSDLPAGDREISLDDIKPVGRDQDSPDDAQPEETVGVDEVVSGEVTQPVPVVDVASLAPSAEDTEPAAAESVLEEAAAETVPPVETVPDAAPDASEAAVETEVDLDPIHAEANAKEEAVEPLGEPTPEVEPVAASEPVSEADAKIEARPEVGPTVPIPAAEIARMAREATEAKGARAAEEAEEVNAAETENEEGSSSEVVTETLAEVYAKQGLTSKARAVYEQLIEANPGDQRLRDRLAALDETSEADSESTQPQYLASETGGTSVRAFLNSILAARPGAVGGQPEPEEDAVALATAPVEPTALEKAFGEGAEEGGDEPEEESPLAAVFEGDEPEDNPAEASVSDEDNMSFDQFFKTDDEGADDQTGEKPEDDEDFKNWLQGLKS